MNREELIYWLGYKSDAKIVKANADGLKLNDAVLENMLRGSYDIKRKYRGDEVYLRGLVELSNICRKDCLYCGIRHSNSKVKRYMLKEDEVMNEVAYAYNAGYGSVVLQSGENTDSNFVELVSRLVYSIKKLNLGITLSLGEQTKEVYKEWFNAGAIRYLLRIESSNEQLYNKIHPSNSLHAYSSRIKAIEDLKSCGYFVGTGVMIGLPYQTIENLADDLLFFKSMDVDMVGMGPYIKHPDTPLALKSLAMDDESKLLLSIKMIALLRRLMPWINIASTTALQVLHPMGREYGLLSGANIVMPNLTDSIQRENYQLYSGKPGLQDDAESTITGLLQNLKNVGIPVGWNVQGNPIRKKDFKE